MNSHPNKHIRAAIDYGLARGWRLREAGGSAHAWGMLYCINAHRDGCRFSIYSTPRDPEGHARYIRRLIDRCPHGDKSETS